MQFQSYLSHFDFFLLKKKYEIDEKIGKKTSISFADELIVEEPMIVLEVDNTVEQ